MAVLRNSPAPDQRPQHHTRPLDSLLVALNEADCGTCRALLHGIKAHLEKSIPLEPTIPIALVTLEQRHGQWIWRVIKCPLCGATGKRSHHHGGGTVGVDDPHRFLSHRSAHCTPMRPGGYLLVEALESQS